MKIRVELYATLNRFLPPGAEGRKATLELPDGSQQILFVDSTGFNTLFITRDQWVASCIAPSAGLLVISPEGVKYTMNYRRGGGTTYGADADFAWYTTRIEDRNGNWINIAYDTGADTSGTNAAILSNAFEAVSPRFWKAR